MNQIPLFYYLVVSLGSMSHPTHSQEYQLTTAAQNHVLTNINVWSPDSRWIVFDVRSGDEFDGNRIEQVNRETGEIVELYQSSNGANCGVVTYNPQQPVVVFILGPENPTFDWKYGFTRRRGVLLDTTAPRSLRSLDAMTYAPPFKAGALRGGSHVHVFSPDGRWVSFTYEDDVLARLESEPHAPLHQKNLRTVGVSVPQGPVKVPHHHPRNHGGEYFSVVVAEVTDIPRPGSDDISKAFEEGWVGSEGYLRPDGSRQRKALAFQGLVTTHDGTQHAEVYIVDLPDDLTQPGDSPLEGGSLTRPSPPKGVAQRRLTFTTERKYPGVSDIPRHWVRSNSDGSMIAFLMRDDTGIAQIFTVSPNGGKINQITANPTSVASAFTWSPDGRYIAHVMDGSICLTNVSSGQTRRLTAKRKDESHISPNACVFSPDGQWIAYTRDTLNSGKRYFQIFLTSVLDLSE